MYFNYLFCLNKLFTALTSKQYPVFFLLLELHLNRRPWCWQGGWISERGRLRDDPYAIVKATPTPAPRNLRAIRLPAVSSDRRLADEEATPGHGDPSPCGHQQQSNAADRGCAKPSQAPGSGCTVPSTGDDEVRQSQVIPGRHEQHEARCESRGRHRDQSSVGTAEGGSRRTQPQSQPASKVVPRAVSARGSFGLATSPSAKTLEAMDTGEKVTCPICHRGMDHWKSGQRQQVTNRAKKFENCCR